MHRRESLANPTMADQRSITWVVSGVVLVESLYIWWTAANGYFFQDDFIDFYQARQAGLSGQLLQQPIFGHFVPGYNLVNYAVASIVPYRWSIIETADVVLFACSLFLLYRLLVTLLGVTWIIVPLVALAGATFSLIPSIVWWASGLEQLVAIPAILLLINCHVRYLTSGQYRYAIFGAIALTVALAFYDGALVAALFVVAMTVLIWPYAGGLEGAGVTLLVYWRAWLAYGVPVLFDLGWRFSHAGLYASPPLPTAVEGLQFVSLSWTQTFVPLLFGIDGWLFSSHLERVAVGALGQTLFVLFVAWTVMRRRSAWRGWALFAVVFLAMTILVGATRVSDFGPVDASDVRYVAIDVFYFVIAVGLVLCPPKDSAFRSTGGLDSVVYGSGRPLHSHRHSRPLPPRRRIVTFGVVIGVGVVALYLVGLPFDQRQDGTVQGDHASRKFFQNFRTSWAGVTSGPFARRFIWDTEIDPVVVSHAFFPDDTASITVGKLSGGLQFNEWGGKGYVVRSDGTVLPTKTVTEATGVLPNAACYGPAERSGTIFAPVDRSLPAARWFDAISFTSTTGATVTQSGGTVIHFPRGSGTLLSDFPPAPLAAVSWNVPPDRNLCITRLRIVTPEVVNSADHPAESLHAPQPPTGRIPTNTR